MTKQTPKRLRNSLIIMAFACLLLPITGCNDNKKQNSEKAIDSVAENIKTDIKANTLYKFDNVVFCIPSPYEFAYFVKNLGINYQKDYLNPSKSALAYSSSFKKAVNIGVYGTDLGYLTIYDQTPDAVNYFVTIKSLTKDLGIASIFGQHTLARIEKNMNKKDSLMFIIASSYREADAYLKDNDRKATAALILAGSWIESQYILTQIAKAMPIKEVFKRVAEQKYPLDNLIKILSVYYNQNKEDKDFIEMTELLVELAYEYDGVDYQYEYKSPTHIAKNNFTIINSVADLEINQEQVKSITKLIEKLRTIIIK